MKKKRFSHIVSEFLEKMRFKYRLSIMNENTLEESWHTRLSRFSVLLFISALVLATFILLTILIFITPLKHYLPGYGDSGNRTKIVQESLRADSIGDALERQEAYLSVLRDILLEKTESANPQKIDTVGLKERAEALVDKSKKEKEFIKNYEESEKYNLSAINSTQAEKSYVFFRPVRGVIASKFDPMEEKFGISIITRPQESVLSVLEGNVVRTALTFDNEWLILVQHNDGYLSVYKNNTKLLKKTGDYVRAGETIAITGTEDEKNQNVRFYFELWKKGKPINPVDVIVF